VRELVEEQEQAGTSAEEQIVKKPCIGKNPDVPTDFLPDQQRDLEQKRLTENFRRRYEEQKALTLKETIKVSFSYFECFKVEKSGCFVKGTSVLQFLEFAKKQFKEEYPFLEKIPADNLVCILNCTILPHRTSFYDLIEGGARNENNAPLLQLVGEVGSPPKLPVLDYSGMIYFIEKAKYEKMKHIYPTSVWKDLDVTLLFETS